MLSKIHPLYAAYAIVAYVQKENKEKFRQIKLKCPTLKIENNIDPQRLFTAPLSLHKRRDVVAMCIDPRKLEKFDIEDTDPDSFKHFKNWNMYVSGEADQLAEKAYKNIGPYSRTLSIERLDKLGNERIDAATKTKL